MTIDNFFASLLFIGFKKQGHFVWRRNKNLCIRSNFSSVYKGKMYTGETELNALFQGLVNDKISTGSKLLSK